MTLSTACPKPPKREKRVPAPIAKSAPRRRNRTRHSREWNRAYESEDRVIWVKHQRCVVCGYAHGPAATHNVHVVGGGGSRKADAQFIVPLCGRLHTQSKDSLHALGLDAFNERHGVDLLALAAATESAWRDYLEQVTP